MRLYEFDEIDHDELTPIWPQIKRECSTALNIYKFDKFDRVLLRGTEGESRQIYKSHSPTNRPPQHTNPLIHNAVSEWFAEQGFKANRDNSIFATSDYGSASFYAWSEKYIFIIIPINGFSFTWSPKVSDLFIHLPVFNKERALYAMLAYGRPREEARQSASLSLEQAMEKTIQFLKDADYTDNNFRGAVDSGHEVMINGSFYAINYKFKSQLWYLLNSA